MVLSSSTSPIEAIKEHHQQPILLTHPPFCPIKCLRPSQAQNLPPEILNRGVDVGVVVLLGNVLIKLELAKYYKDSEMTAFISERSRNSK